MPKFRLMAICTLLILTTNCTSLRNVTMTLEEQKLTAQAAVVLITDATGTTGGTGFHVRLPSGAVAILTNSHICELADSTGTLYISDDQTTRLMKRKVIDNSDTTDLCLIEGLPGRSGLKLADTAPKHGDAVRVEGHPQLAPTLESSGTLIGERVVSILVSYIQDETDEAKCLSKSKNKVEVVNSFFGPIPACVAVLPAYGISAATFGGNSGSPVINDKGDVAAVVFAGDPRTNWGFAITLPVIKAFVADY